LRAESKIGNNPERTIEGKALVVKLEKGKARGETSWFVFDVQSFEFSKIGSHSKHGCFIATAFTEINKNFLQPASRPTRPTLSLVVAGSLLLKV
jgi:hypothetical protein